MGMFDYIRCKYPLPIDGFQDRVFQTKDTPALGEYVWEIREDGTLWNDLGQEHHFSGEIYFYDFYARGKGWIEFNALFEAGVVQEIKVAINSPPQHTA